MITKKKLTYRVGPTIINCTNDDSFKMPIHCREMQRSQTNLISLDVELREEIVKYARSRRNRVESKLFAQIYLTWICSACK